MALADAFRVDAGLAISIASSLRTAGTTVDSLVLAERSQGLHNSWEEQQLSDLTKATDHETESDIRFP